MEVSFFKKLFEDNCKKIKLEKFKNSFFIESDESIIFFILRKSGYSQKYYLRVKAVIKPIEKDFDKNEFIKHDIADIILSIDSENPKIFDLENEIQDLERIQSMEVFFKTNVENWINTLRSKESIKEKFSREKLFMLPYTKSKIGLK